MGVSDVQIWGVWDLALISCLCIIKPNTIVDYAVCDKADTLPQTQQPYLDYGVYASIVGDCAYDTKACGITRQNLLDLVYSELSKAGATIYPP